jgi:peptidoglycan-associated lipoprotein
VALGAALGAAGCIATEDWVKQQIAQANAPVQTKVAQVETGLAQERTAREQVNARVTQVDGRVTQVDGRVSQVATQVTQARAVADQGVQKAGAVDARLTQALANRLKRTPVLQVDMFFATNKSDLSTEAQAALQGVVKLLGDNPTYTADIVGFTDKRGTPGYNLNLSWRREEAIRRFLLEKGAPLNRFYFIGLGEDVATGTTAKAEAKDRRGAVQVYKPAD